MSDKQPPNDDTQQRLNIIKELVPTSTLEESAVRALGRPCRVTGATFRAAADHVTGFLGDHFRVTLRVTPHGDGHTQTLQLFVKTSSLLNKEKAAFIDAGNFFRRERLVFSLFDELGGGDGDAAWHAQSLYHSDEVLVMRDMTSLGYSTQCVSVPFDRPHLLQGVAAIARFHASFANYTMDKSANGQLYNPEQEYGVVIKESTFLDCAWLRTAAKLNADMARQLSDKYNDLPNLQEDLTDAYISSCECLSAHADTLNVLVHKDTWANNILFRHEQGQPVHAVLIDYQCVRYAPPAFDLIIYIYLNTTQETRHLFEDKVIQHYYTVFTGHLKDATKDWVSSMEYDLQCLRDWCERGRMLGMVVALSILPYILMDGQSARMFDEPQTYVALCDEDRSGPVLQYAATHQHYTDRQMEVLHEFIHRYLRK